MTGIITAPPQQLPYTKSDAIAEWFDEDRWTMNQILSCWYEYAPDLPRGLLYGAIHEHLDKVFGERWNDIKSPDECVTPARYLEYIKRDKDFNYSLFRRILHFGAVKNVGSWGEL
jgi:hypothetical protein